MPAIDGNDCLKTVTESCAGLLGGVYVQVRYGVHIGHLEVLLVVEGDTVDHCGQFALYDVIHRVATWSGGMRQVL